MDRDIKIVALGGGTGLSTMLRGLKYYTKNITAVVTVSDDGGGSGKLREEMKMLPPGDIRNCIVALANIEPMMEKLFQYRFKEGTLQGQSFGNIYLAAMNDLFGSFEKAIEKTSEVLAVTGQVLPVSLEDVILCGELDNGLTIKGESKIVEVCKATHSKIKKIYLEPTPVRPYEKVLRAIEEADIILLGPGSLYTSLLPNLLVEGIAKSIEASKAKVVYIANLMTQPGETDGLNLEEHIEVIANYLDKEAIDVVIVNDEPIPELILDHYLEEGAQPLSYQSSYSGAYQLIKGSLVKIHEGELYIRHDERKLAEMVIQLIQ